MHIVLYKWQIHTNKNKNKKHILAAAKIKCKILYKIPRRNTAKNTEKKTKNKYICVL